MKYETNGGLYVIGIGTNLGDKKKNISKVLGIIDISYKIIKISNLYESDALVLPEMAKQWQEKYYNMATLIETDQSTYQLFEELKDIEIRIGRDLNAGRYAPRIIDLDILIARDTNISNDKLTIPHEGLLVRDFALVPAQEVAPDFLLPSGKKIIDVSAPKNVPIKKINFNFVTNSKNFT